MWQRPSRRSRYLSTITFRYLLGKLSGASNKPVWFAGNYTTYLLSNLTTCLAPLNSTPGRLKVPQSEDPGLRRPTRRPTFLGPLTSTPGRLRVPQSEDPVHRRPTRWPTSLGLITSTPGRLRVPHSEVPGHRRPIRWPPYLSMTTLRYLLVKLPGASNKTIWPGHTRQHTTDIQEKTTTILLDLGTVSITQACHSVITSSCPNECIYKGSACVPCYVSYSTLLFRKQVYKIV